MSELKHIPHLPLRLLGLENIPAIPFQLVETLETLVRLGKREDQTQQAKQGFSNVYQIGGYDNTGYAYLFGTGDTGTADARAALTAKLQGSGKVGMLGEAAMLAQLIEELRADHHAATDAAAVAAAAAVEPITAVSLEEPGQFALSWTTFPPVYRDALPLLPAWEASLTDAETASRLFWPTIADYGLAYNLLILAKVGPALLAELQAVFPGSWTPELDAAAAAGLLYAIDLRLYEKLEPQTVNNKPRFTPATLTVLVQDAATKALLPELVRVSGYQGAGATTYSRKGASPSAWLYALQAAKTSVTVYGIWLGHVYHWHIPTGAMQMTLWNNVPTGHVLLQLLGPQSNFLIAFDDVLLLLWKKIAPPTSIASAWQFLKLMNDFAKDRDFFDDDPPAEIRKLGLRLEDFTVDKPWDAYPLVGHLLEIWQATEDYVAAFVAANYASDDAVRQDAALQSWIAAAGAKGEGNLRGLPAMDSRDALAKVLTSQIFRVNSHGTSRLSQSANPALTFIANFPPCLQQTEIPAPTAELTTKQLLAFLPNTGTMGEMMSFYTIFSFSVPYVPFVPLAGIEENLFFPGGPANPGNVALVKLRHQIVSFIGQLDPGSPQRFQWPLNVET
jgi:hypothetical protein